MIQFCNQRSQCNQSGCGWGRMKFKAIITSTVSLSTALDTWNPTLKEKKRQTRNQQKPEDSVSIFFFIYMIFIYSLSHPKQSQYLWIILALTKLLGKHLLFKFALIELNSVRIIRGLNICLNGNAFHLARHSAGKSPGADVWFLSDGITATNLEKKNHPLISLIYLSQNQNEETSSSETSTEPSRIMY